ncbi:MAG: SGNH/GDSL hydrolase family protein [Magnetospirillum sp.]|nr:SGNH/GDSL hydrolase family protein [Magnetospirillum sp.]
MSASRIKGAILNLGLTLASIAFALVLLEGALAVSHRMNYDSPLPYGLRDEGDRLTYVRLVPNFRGTSRTGIEYATNALGFRDDPVDGHRRHVIFLGDSTTFGLNVAHDETYTERFEALVRAAGEDIQAINTATPGQGTLDERDALQGVLGRSGIHPTAVVLAFFPNDFVNNLEYTGYRQSVERHNAATLSWKQRIDEELARFRVWRSFIGYYFALREAAYSNALVVAGNAKTTAPGATKDVEAQSLPRNGRPLLDGHAEYAAKPGREVEWNLLTDAELQSNRAFTVTVEALHQIAALCRQRDVPLLVIHLPTYADEILGTHEARYKAKLAELIRAEGGQFLDIAAEYRRILAAGPAGNDLERALAESGITPGHPNAVSSGHIAAAVAALYFDRKRTRPP